MASLYKRGKVWQIKYKVDGKWVQTSLKATKKSDAVDAMYRLLAAKDEGVVIESEALPVATLRVKYEDWAKDHRRRATIESRVRALKRIEDYFPEVAVHEVTIAMVEAYKRRYAALGNLGKPVGGRAVNEAVVALGSVWNRGIKQGWFVGPNPWHKTEHLEEPRSTVRWLTEEQIAKALESAEEVGQDQHITWALGIYAGFRKGEIVEARWEWFDFDRRVITIRGTETWRPKDKEERSLPLAAKLADILRPYRRERGYLIGPEVTQGKNRYRFDPRKGFDAVRAATGLDWCHPHILRHTFASRLVQEGVSIYKVARWMGHSTTAVTERYGHLQPQDDDIDRI